MIHFLLRSYDPSYVLLKPRSSSMTIPSGARTGDPYESARTRVHTYLVVPLTSPYLNSQSQDLNKGWVVSARQRITETRNQARRHFTPNIRKGSIPNKTLLLLYYAHLSVRESSESGTNDADYPRETRTDTCTPGVIPPRSSSHPPLVLRCARLGS